MFRRTRKRHAAKPLFRIAGIFSKFLPLKHGGSVCAPYSLSFFVFLVLTYFSYDFSDLGSSLAAPTLEL
jgi:hypothetical protein